MLGYLFLGLAFGLLLQESWRFLPIFRRRNRL